MDESQRANFSPVEDTKTASSEIDETMTAAFGGYWMKRRDGRKAAKRSLVWTLEDEGSADLT